VVDDAEDKKTFVPFLKPIYTFCESSYFEYFIAGCILGNTITLAWDHHPITREEVRRLDIANNCFTIVFILEMIIKLLAYGSSQYASDNFNLMDCALVCIACIEFFIPSGL